MSGLLEMLGLDKLRPTEDWQRLMASLAPGADALASNVSGFIHDDPATKAKVRHWWDTTSTEDKVRQIGPWVPGIGEGVMVASAAADYGNAQEQGTSGLPAGLAMAMLGMMPGAGAVGGIARKLSRAESATLAKLNQMSKTKQWTPEEFAAEIDAAAAKKAPPVAAAGGSGGPPIDPPIDRVLGVPQVPQVYQGMRRQGRPSPRAEWVSTPEPLADPPQTLIEAIKAASAHAQPAEQGLAALAARKPTEVLSPEQLAPARAAQSIADALQRRKPPPDPAKSGALGAAPGMLAMGAGLALPGHAVDSRDRQDTSHDMPGAGLAELGGLAALVGGGAGLFRGKMANASHLADILKAKANASLLSGEADALRQGMPRALPDIEGDMAGVGDYRNRLLEAIAAAEAKGSRIPNSGNASVANDYRTYLNELQTLSANAGTRRDDLAHEYAAASLTGGGSLPVPKEIAFQERTALPPGSRFPLLPPSNGPADAMPAQLAAPSRLMPSSIPEGTASSIDPTSAAPSFVPPLPQMPPVSITPPNGLPGVNGAATPKFPLKFRPNAPATPNPPLSSLWAQIQAASAHPGANVFVPPKPVVPPPKPFNPAIPNPPPAKTYRHIPKGRGSRHQDPNTGKFVSQDDIAKNKAAADQMMKDRAEKLNQNIQDRKTRGHNNQASLSLYDQLFGTA